MRRTVVTRIALVSLSCAVLSVAWAGDGEQKAGELGIQAGVVLPDEDLSGRPGMLDALEPLIGLRGGYFFAPRWGWFVDTVFWDFDTSDPTRDAATYAARTGFEVFTAPHWEEFQTYLAFGGGWQVTDLDPGEDFDRAFASLGLGQRFGIGANNLFRWELRADHTLGDDGLGGRDLTTAYLTIGLGWGMPTRAGDADGDGVPDRRDACPATPARAQVDARGCPLDGDGDGVFDGIDRCPGTPAGWPVDAAGCPLDEDGDGVFDGADRCPATPAGVAVDERGCPLDRDGDGVDDPRDACPDTPARARVDGRGCPLDEDGDGVWDGIDECPRTPRFAHVDGRGCPLDGDGDGVWDGIDRCPTTPPGTPVNPEGCPRAEPLFEEERRTLILEGVFFELDSAMLRPNSRTILDTVARSLLDWPEVRVEIGGHTDSSGSEAYNDTLSRRRAEAVRDYLIQKGVPARQLESRGYGESRPIADNRTKEGRARNRRVELTRLD